jgi:hypothetical protein
VSGFVREEVGWAEEERRTGVSREQWMTNVGPHVQQLIDSGKYPIFTRLLMESQQAWLAAETRFESGLRRVLDSIAAALPERASDG